MYAEYSNRHKSEVSSPKITTGESSTASTAVKAKPIKSVNSYLDRITIAGLHNYLYARGKYEKFAWNLTFLLAIAGTVYYMVPAVQQYLSSTIVLDIQQQTDPSLRLPNPWVCHFAVNMTYLREEFDKVKPELEADKRVQLLRHRYARLFEQTIPATVDNLTYVALNFMTAIPVWAEESNTNWKDRFLPQFAFEYISKAIDAMGSNWTGIKTFYEKGFYDCHTTVTNCNLNGMAFDCCRYGSLILNKALDKCVALDIRREAFERKLQQNETNKRIELRFETLVLDQSMEFFEFDSRTWTSTISFGNRVDSMIFDENQVVPGGAESTITVRGSKKEKLANCVKAYKYRPELHSNTHPILREYFEGMIDPEQYSVAACQMGKLFEALFFKCGCVPYYDYMRPQNDTDICTPAHFHTCVYRAFQNELPISAGANAGLQSSPSSAEEDVKRDLFHNLKNLMDAECVQICESWIYDYTIFSTSIEDLEGNISSINRTKVTIVFDPEYRIETEVYKMDYGAFIASVGEACGLILGFSAITLIQLLIWSIVACLYKKKQNRITPMRKQDAGHAQGRRQ